MNDLFTAVRTASDRLLHQVRRASLLDSLARRANTHALLVVCFGNLCRSPFAAAVLAKLLASSGIHVQSAGLFRSGRRSPATALEAAAKLGVDLSTHRSRLVTGDLVQAAQLVVVMDLHQARAISAGFGRRARDVILLGDLDPEAITSRNIRDLADQPLDAYADVYARIERCSIALANTLQRSLALVTA